MADITQFTGKVVSRSDTKPLYIIVAEDPREKGGYSFYATKELALEGMVYDIRGWKLSKTNAEKLTKNLNQKEELCKSSVNKKIPINRIIEIDNLTYKVANS